MKRLLIVYAIDCAAIGAAMYTVGSAHGYWWGLLAGVAAAVYGLFCYMDGLARA
jgi:hypothetical protein